MVSFNTFVPTTTATTQAGAASKAPQFLAADPAKEAAKKSLKAAAGQLKGQAGAAANALLGNLERLTDLGASTAFHGHLEKK